MTREIKPLEERIREKARTQLEDDINAAANALELFMRFGYAVESGMYSGEGKSLQLWEAIGIIKKRISTELRAKREDEALGDFIEKVDQLQAQVEELKAFGPSA